LRYLHLAINRPLLRTGSNTFTSRFASTASVSKHLDRRLALARPPPRPSCLSRVALQLISRSVSVGPILGALASPRRCKPSRSMAFSRGFASFPQTLATLPSDPAAATSISRCALCVCTCQASRSCSIPGAQPKSMGAQTAARSAQRLICLWAPTPLGDRRRELTCKERGRRCRAGRFVPRLLIAIAFARRSPGSDEPAAEACAPSGASIFCYRCFYRQIDA
jgi:hypothetical protein